MWTDQNVSNFGVIYSMKLDFNPISLSFLSYDPIAVSISSNPIAGKPAKTLLQLVYVVP